MTKLDLFQICKADSIPENCINTVQKENRMIISIDAVKEFDKINH